MKYIEPQMEVTAVLTKSLMADPLMGSGSGPQPGTNNGGGAPKRVGDIIE